MPKITFLPSEKTISSQAGKDLLTLSREAGVFIPSGCAGEGVCGLCRVKIIKGEVNSEPTGKLSKKELKEGFRLACRTMIKNEDVVVQVPARLEAYHLQPGGSVEEIEQKFFTKPKFKFEPLVEKIYLQLSKPTLTDALSDLERVFEQIRKMKKTKHCQTSLANIKILPGLLRKADFKITATILDLNGNINILAFEAGDSSKKNFGVVVDIGTTTISAQLIDLCNGEVRSTQASFNKQLQWGEDVITRIVHASESSGRGLEELHHAVVNNINELLLALISTASLTSKTEITLADINAVVCSGNTTMIHLLLKIDPANIRKEPYAPVVNEIPVVSAAECGIDINPKAILISLPCVSTYVGADICAGVLACGLYQEENVNLLIDIGTNGEIALGNKDWLICCAASAGPAFEGSGTACGMKAAAGAIQKVKIDKDKEKDYKISYSTIKEEKPRGICGSGYIDLLAQMLINRIINRDGKLLDSVAGIEKVNRSLCFTIYKNRDDKDSNVYINQEDIENLKRSKGAIYAAFCILLKKVNLSFKDIKKIYIAGGFGRFLNMKNAITIGLLPDLKEKVFEFVGNSSLSGAKDVLLSKQAYQDVKRIRRMMTYVELSTEGSYMEEYTKALFFPHTEIERFKSVKFEPPQEH